MNRGKASLTRSSALVGTSVTSFRISNVRARSQSTPSLATDVASWTDEPVTANDGEGENHHRHNQLLEINYDYSRAMNDLLQTDKQPDLDTSS